MKNEKSVMTAGTKTPSANDQPAEARPDYPRPEQPSDAVWQRHPSELAQPDQRTVPVRRPLFRT